MHKFGQTKYPCDILDFKEAMLTTCSFVVNMQL